MPRPPFEWQEDFQRLGERVDDFFDHVFGLASAPRYGLQYTWRPSVDVYRVADGIAVVAELPGVEEADLKVVAERGRLRIAGARRAVSVGDGAEPLQLELEYGPFDHIVTLPPGVDTDRITARLAGGLLHVHIPLRDPARSVPVRVEPSRNE